ncbi:unnamed protein product [Sphagnum jensenii]
MSELLLALLLISTALLASVVVQLVLNYVLLRKSSRMRLPPGPWPWPVVGNLLQLYQGGKNLHKTLASLAQQYGPIVYLRLGSVHTVVLSSPMMAKEFLKTHDQEFQYRPKPTLAAEILVGNNGVAMSTGGPLSRHLRRICLTELFATKHLQSFESMRTKEINNTINDIHMESEEGKVVDLKSRISSLIINIMTNMMFRKRYFGVDQSKQNEIHCFKEVITKVPHWIGSLIISDYIPSLRWLVRLQGIEASLHALRHKKSQFIQNLIAEHKNVAIEVDQVKESGNENVTKTTKDFVDILLSAPQEDGTGNLSKETIETLVLEMFVGGVETSSVTIEWAMAELIRNPMIMKRAQMELETVVGMNRIIEESDLHKLTYLQAVIKETFRLHPPIPLLVPRSSINKVCGIAEGYDIPPHTKVMVNVWAMGRDPSIWERPFEFYPERFLQQGQEHHHIATEIIDMDENNFKLFPFGSGRRACPGRPLGILVVQIVLARLLHSFHWVLPNHQEPNTLDMSEEFGMSLPRAQQLHLKAYPKLQAHLYR